MTLINPQSTKANDMTHSSMLYNDKASTETYNVKHSTRAKATKVSSTVEGSR